MPAEAHEITRLLQAWGEGDQNALEQLAPLVESELHQLARAYLHKEAADHTLQPTALVNEVYLRLMGWNAEKWENRAHFYAIAAKMMRRVLVNQAINRRRQKRGGGAVLVSLADIGGGERRADIVALDEVLHALARFDDRKSRVVELRFFGGLDAEETARILGISPRTVHREWNLARAWLFRELRGRTPKDRNADAGKQTRRIC